MKRLRSIVSVLSVMATFTVPVASVSAMQAKADEALAYRVCKLLEAPFIGAITSGDGDGCEWGLTQPDGVTIEGEKIRSMATGVLTKDELTANFDSRLKTFQEGAQSGAFKLQPLPACEGGWQVASTIRPGHPTRMAFYKCNKRVVSVETEGIKSVRQFEHLTVQMAGLVK